MTRTRDEQQVTQKPASKPPSSKPAPKYYSPIGTRNYRISQQWHHPSSRYKSGRHEGVDIAVPVGTSVTSVVPGKVIYVGNAGAYGNRVVIRGNDGLEYSYNHLNSFNVQVGQSVNGGDLIAYSGNTGNSTGPHLHFQVDQGGHSIDPSFIFGRDVATHEYASSTANAYGGKNGGSGMASTGSALVNELKMAGFRLPFNTKPYVDQVLRSGLAGQEAQDYLYSLIIASPEFKTAYPGIFRPDGTMIVTPAAYTALREQYTSTAHQYGFNVNDSQVGQLIQRGVSSDEFKTRAEAVHTITTNPDVFAALQSQVTDMNRSRAQLGLPPIKWINNLGDAVNFVLGQADRDVYDAYEAASIASAAASAGVKISSAQARGAAAQTVGVLSKEDVDQHFAQIAQDLRAAGPEIHQFGLTNADLLTLEFGGPNRGKIALAAQQALSQREAQLKVGAQTNVQLDKQNRPVTPDQSSVGF